MATITKIDTRTFAGNFCAGGILDYVVAVAAPATGTEKQNGFAASLASKLAESARQRILSMLSICDNAVRTGKATKAEADAKLAEEIGKLEAKLTEAEALPIKTWLDNRISNISQI